MESPRKHETNLSMQFVALAKSRDFRYNRIMSVKFLAVLAIFPALFFFSCQTTKHERFHKEDKILKLVFAGDIMAHTQNFQMDDFSLIWDDIREKVGAADFAFANLEAPVVQSLPFESYPTFNMQHSYPQAAFDAGFNLISLANNHTDDQNSEGIRATQIWAESVAEKSCESERPIYFSGLTNDGEFSFAQFFWNEKKILFIAATEILNTWKNYDKVNFIRPNASGRAAFVERIRKMREEFSPDIFLVSIHTSEEEYVMTVLESVKKFYRDLLDAGADIVVSNHPHVIRPVEFFGETDSRKIRKVIMYANGNTISGQRRALNYENPLDTWQYTGDGQFVELELDSDENGFFVKSHKINFITAFTPAGTKSPVIKILDENFISSLEAQGETKNAKYYRARLDALKKIEEIQTWQ